MKMQLHSLHVRKAVLLALVLLAQGLCADTHYAVMPGTPGANPETPYLSWETAGTDLVEVVSTALKGSGTKLVRVADGTYYPTNTIIASGGLVLKSENGRDATIINGRDNPNRGFDFKSATLDGFTITNHVVTAGNSAGGYGDAMTLVNCLIAGNQCLAGVGGGCYIIGASTITNCIFKGNSSSSYGGGMYYSGYGLKVKDCRFEDNQVTSSSKYGGGVYVNGSYNCLFTNCQIIGNSAGRGGGFSTLNTSTKGTITITHSTIISNAATASNGSCGGLYIDGRTTALFCEITDNKVVTGVTPPAGDGGGAGGGGSLRNCLIARNYSDKRAGGYFGSANSVIENCTIVSNSASSDVGGVWFLVASGAGTNNIIYHNTAPSHPNYLHVGGDTGLVHSCVYPAVSGAGNITNDPRLVSLAVGDYRLRPASRCVDGGLNLGWMAAAFDLDGNPRIRHGAAHGTVDMGAYESFDPTGSVLLVR